MSQFEWWPDPDAQPDRCGLARIPVCRVAQKKTGVKKQKKIGVRSFIIVSVIQTNSIVVINIFAPVCAIDHVIERAYESES